MKFDPNRHHRKSLRVLGYDYSRPGAYFVTMVTHQRECLFGEVVDGEMRLNENGEIVQWEWKHLAQRFSFIELGTYAVMPNHFHGILIFHDSVGATHPGQINAHSNNTNAQTIIPVDNNGSPLPSAGHPLSHGPKTSSLGAVIGQFKSRITKRIWKNPDFNETPIWQRNYYEHIIRNDDNLNRIHNYIQANPVNWQDDEENPINAR